MQLIASMAWATAEGSTVCRGCYSLQMDCPFWSKQPHEHEIKCRRLPHRIAVTGSCRHTLCFFFACLILINTDKLIRSGVLRPYRCSIAGDPAAHFNCCLFQTCHAKPAIKSYHHITACILFSALCRTVGKGRQNAGAVQLPLRETALVRHGRVPTACLPQQHEAEARVVLAHERANTKANRNMPMMRHAVARPGQLRY